MKPSPLRVLLVEDDDADALLTTRAFRGLPDVVLTRVDSGEEALERLAIPEFRPHLVLLDISLPGIDGHDVLESVKRDEVLRRIPVVALTSSRSDEDVVRSWEAQVAGYLAKPVDLAAFRELADHLVGWWSLNEFPP